MLFLIKFSLSFHLLYLQRILHFSTLGSPSNIEIKSAMETSITGMKILRKMDHLTAELDDMEIKTFKVTLAAAA